MADQNIIKAIAKWGKDKLGNIIAYKTLTRCVFDDDGNRLSDILASGGTGTAALMTNEDAGVGRPDGTTIEVKENGIFGLINSDYCQNINLLYSEEIQNCNNLTDSTKRYLLNTDTLNKPSELNQNFILITIPANENNIIYYQIAIASDNSNQFMRSYSMASTGPFWSNWKYSGFVKYGDYEDIAIDANECISLNTIYNINNGSLESKNLPPSFGCGILFVGVSAYSSATYWQYAINFQNGKTYYRYATTQPFTYDSWKAWTEVKGTEGNIIIDSELSINSENPVQNKVVTAELNNLRQMITGSIETVHVNYYVTFTSAATGAAGYVDKYYNNLLTGEKTPFNYDTGKEGVPICGGMLQWYYPSSPYAGDLKVNVGCYVNGNKVEAGEFLFQAVNFGSLRNYKYSISVVPWTKPETI